ncbi:hypothetical protein ACWD3Z_39970 [Streptomyces sp. NPDC002740]
MRPGGSPNYTGDRVVASPWTFNATAWDKNGNQSVLFTGGVVRNELGGKNFGPQKDEDGNLKDLPEINVLV